MELRYRTEMRSNVSEDIVPPSDTDTEFGRLGDVLHKWRRMSELDLKAVAEEIGISVSTLSRLERGNTPDGDTLRKVWSWLMG
jgi:predicted transcriptional regulator